jgi:hypothetical protein
MDYIEMNYVEDRMCLTMAMLAFGLLQGPASVPDVQGGTLRATRSITFILNAPPDAAFPLFGPRDEHLWLPSWNPSFVFPPDGSQTSEGAVFVVPPAGEAPEETWLMTTYDPGARVVEYVIVAPGYLAGELRIAVEPSGSEKSEVTVRYRFTALSTAGRVFLSRWAEHFPHQGAHWSDTINGYLAGQGRTHE